MIIALFPGEIKEWLIENCKLGWVTDKLAIMWIDKHLNNKE